MVILKIIVNRKGVAMNKPDESITDLLTGMAGVASILMLITCGFLKWYNNGIKTHNTVGTEWWCKGHIDADRLYYSNHEAYVSICSKYGITETDYRRANMRASYGAWIPARGIWFTPNYPIDKKTIDE